MIQGLAQVFANRLDGEEYPLSVDFEYAKANSLVVAFCLSDDLLEFRGAIHDELSAIDGALAYIFNGKAIDKSTLIKDQVVLQKYGFLTTRPSISVEAIWEPEGIDAVWLVKVMGVESASFNIMQDGEVFCQGAVFQL